jgi:hypothetical protein
VRFKYPDRPNRRSSLTSVGLVIASSARQDWLGKAGRMPEGQSPNGPRNFGLQWRPKAPIRHECISTLEPSADSEREDEGASLLSKQNHALKSKLYPINWSSWRPTPYETVTLRSPCSSPRFIPTCDSKPSERILPPSQPSWRNGDAKLVLDLQFRHRINPQAAWP